MHRIRGMSRTFSRFPLGILILTLSLVSTACSSSSNGDDTTATTRNLTGTIDQTSLTAALRVKGLVKSAVASCAEAQVCCTEYGSDAPLVVQVNADCTFTTPLPVESYCGCWIAGGTDEDGDGCGDDTLASLGCAENKYSGFIPTGAEGTDDIELGESQIEGFRVVSTGNACAQVDSDDDGTPDSSDTDADGNGTADDDEVDIYEACIGLDSNSDNTIDLFQPEVWDALEDTDSDGIPDLCDCEEGDDDGCISAEFNLFDRDEDADGYPAWDDCDDEDATVTNSCYSDTYCDEDNDQDGFGLCDDCDDSDPETTYECFGGSYCDEDNDQDGLGYCFDCNDNDAESNVECYSDALGDICDQDNDGDGEGFCGDCDDFDDTVSDECYESSESICSQDNDEDGVTYCNDCDDFDDSISDGCEFDNGDEDEDCTEEQDALCDDAASEVSGDIDVSEITTCGNTSEACEIDCGSLEDSGESSTCVSLVEAEDGECDGDGLCTFIR